MIVIVNWMIKSETINEKINKYDIKYETLIDATHRFKHTHFCSTGQTTNLQAHLKQHGVNESSSTPSQKQTKQALLTTMVVPLLPLNKTRQEQITQAVCEFIVDGQHPLSLVEEDSFRKFMGTLEPRYQPTCAKTISQRVKAMYSQMVAVVMEELSEIEHVAITHDSWTSLNNESYDTVTAHFIDKSWGLRTRVLQTSKVEGSHTAETIQETLEATKAKWSLPDTIAVSDNASNEVKAFKLLGWPRLQCMGHNINLCVKAGLQIPQIAKLTSKGRAVVSFFHRSPSATGLLKSKQKLLLPAKQHNLNLLQDVPTRWNSTLDMLTRLLDLTPAIHAAVLDKDAPRRVQELRPKLFSMEEQTLAEKTIHLLQPFKTATVLLSSESVVTLHKVIPVALKLRRCLEPLEADPGCVKTMKKEMLSNFDKRQTMDNAHQLASFLNAETKSLLFIDDKAHVKDLALSELRKLRAVEKEAPLAVKEEPVDPVLPALPEASPPPKVKVDLQSTEGPPPEKKHKDDDSSWLDDVIYMGEEPPKPLDQDMEEMERYGVEGQLSPGGSAGNDLDWWKVHAPLHPNLARLAKKFLAIPASSVSSERIFSLAGNIVTKKRCRLSAEMVDMLVFLNKNRKCDKRVWRSSHWVG